MHYSCWPISITHHMPCYSLCASCVQPTTTFGSVRSICAEMQNIALPAGFTAPRFNGACGPLLSSIFNQSFTDQATVPWAFQSFTVASSADLDAMRVQLASVADYFERDLVAKTTDFTAHIMVRVCPASPAIWLAHHFV